MYSIGVALKNAQMPLAKVSHTPRLDAELLLMHCLQKPKEFLYQYDQLQLNSEQFITFECYLNRRLQGEPIAYIRGKTEFFSLPLKVTTDTLIPRPDTEILVQWALDQFPLPHNSSIRIADLGTGCGAIALALANARPNWTVIATEHSPNALLVAKQNAKALSINNIEFYLNAHKTHWCSSILNGLFSAIIANPPYIDLNDTAISPFVRRYEPKSALFSADEGLSDLKKIIVEARNYLNPGGFLALEHGYRQAKAVKDFMISQNYIHVNTQKDLSGHDRLTMGMKKNV